MALCAIHQHFGRPGTPPDQAWIESFLGHLQYEFPHLLTIAAPAVLRAELDVVRANYNGVRLYAGIGHVTPDDEHYGRGAAIRKAREAASKLLVCAASHTIESTPRTRPTRDPVMLTDQSGISIANSETGHRPRARVASFGAAQYHSPSRLVERRDMGFKALRFFCVMSLVIGSGVLARGPLTSAVRDMSVSRTTSHLSPAPSYGRLAASFVPNRGQAAQGVDFVAGGAGYGLSLKPTGATLALTKGSHPQLTQERQPPDESRVLGLASSTAASKTTAIMGINLVGSNLRARPLEQAPLGGKVNYLAGSDHSRWLTGLPTFGRVTYSDVYAGVNLTWYGDQGALEYDFVVAPGAEPGVISLGFAGAESVRVNEAGDLVLAVSDGEVIQHAPTMYQDLDGKKHPVTGRFLLRNDNSVGFEVGAYDRGSPLVIDPVIGYSTYLGGKNADFGSSIQVDSQGYAYVAGPTQSAAFPTAPGAFDTSYNGGQDGFISKLTPDGSALVFSTFLGGSSTDDADTIALGGSGAVYVRGITRSPDFPVTAGAFDTTFNGGVDAYVAKLGADGSSLEFSSFLGGHGFDSGSGIAVDSQGSAYVAGITGSPDFPTTPGAFQRTFHGAGGMFPPQPGQGDYDAYATKFTPDGSALAYSTFLGGSALEVALEVAVDAGGRATVGGITVSHDYPTTTGAYQTTFGGGRTDAFVTRLAPDGSHLAYSTFLGGTGDDGLFGLSVDSSGAAYVTGSTDSADFPTTPRAYDTSYNGNQDAFVAKLSTNGSALRFSTFLGGSQTDEGDAVAVDGEGATYVTGVTRSADFPTTPGAYDRSYNRGGDALVAKLSPDGSVLDYSTFLGGDESDAGYSIALDQRETVFLTGLTGSPNFPTSPGAFDSTYNGGSSDAFVTKLRVTG